MTFDQFWLIALPAGTLVVVLFFARVLGPRLKHREETGRRALALRLAAIVKRARGEDE